MSVEWSDDALDLLADIYVTEPATSRDEIEVSVHGVSPKPSHI